MKTKFLITMTAGALALVSIADAQSRTIFDTASDSRQFSTFVRLVTQADLVQTLNMAGPYTVFAPTDAAFAALPEGTRNYLMNNPEALKKVLMYHVVPGRYNEYQVKRGGRMDAVPTALDGASLDIRFVGNNVKVGNSTVTMPDVMASNGIIHGIDRVLIPNARYMRGTPRTMTTQSRDHATAQASSVFEIATDSGRFPTFVKLVREAGLVETLNGNGPFTLFIPTEEAFAAISDRDLNELMEDKDKLKSVLLYHVVPSRLMANQVMTMHGRDARTSLDGKSLRIRIDGDRVYVSDARVIQTNMSARNGIVHIIDKVLMP